MFLIDFTSETATILNCLDNGQAVQNIIEFKAVCWFLWEHLTNFLGEGHVFLEIKKKHESTKTMKCGINLVFFFFNFIEPYQVAMSHKF